MNHQKSGTVCISKTAWSRMRSSHLSTRPSLFEHPLCTTPRASWCLATCQGSSWWPHFDVFPVYTSVFINLVSCCTRWSFTRRYSVTMPAVTKYPSIKWFLRFLHVWGPLVEKRCVGGLQVASPCLASCGVNVSDKWTGRHCPEMASACVPQNCLFMFLSFCNIHLSTNCQSSIWHWHMAGEIYGPLTFYAYVYMFV